MKEMKLIEGVFEVDVNFLDWVNDSLTTDGEIPPNVVKYLTVIAAS